MASSTGASAQSNWRLSESPTLVIGSVDGTPSAVFHDIRGVVAATDSLIVIADGGSRELRVFSKTGEFVTAFGRGGDGPKEFRAIEWVDMCGGSAVVVYDFTRFRITRWDTRGTLLDDFAVDGTEDGRPPYSVSCGPDDAFAVVGWPDVMSGYTGEVGPYRLDVTIGVVDGRGRLERIVGTFPGPERYRYPNNDGPWRLGKSTTARLGSDGVYVGTADSFAIQVIAPDGSQRSFGRKQVATRLTSEMRERYRESIVSRVPAARRPAARTTLRAIELPSSLPAYSDFQIDRLGFVWVSPYEIPGQQATDGMDWDVFSPDGEFVASVRIPVHFRPTEIGDDYMLGVSTDTLGVQRAHMYSLSR